MPVPGAGRVADDVARAYDADAGFVSPHADAVGDDDVLVLGVQVRVGSHAGREVHGLGVQALQSARQCLDPDLLRGVEQRLPFLGGGLPWLACAAPARSQPAVVWTTTILPARRVRGDPLLADSEGPAQQPRSAR